MTYYSKQTGGFYLNDVHGDGIPGDAIEISEQRHLELLAGQSQGFEIVAGEDGAPVLADVAATPAQTQARFVAAIQGRLDEFARTRNYDSILSACTYASSSVAKFMAEGMRAVELRDQTWAAAYEILAQVQAGTRPMPAGISDIEADLPVLEWPQ